MPDSKGIGTFVNDQLELATDSIDLFSIPHAEISMIHGKNVIYYPTAPLSDDGPFEFIMPNDSNEYTDLPATTIYGEVEVLKADGTAIAAGDKISCVNLFPQSLWKQIEVYLNGFCINDLTTPTYAFKSFLETHLTYDTNMKETTLAACEMYLKDTINEEKDLPAAMAKATSGITQRHALITGKRICFDIIPHVDFLQSKRYLLPGVEMKIKLVKADDNFGLLHSHAANAYKVKFHKLQLCARKATLDPKVSAMIEKAMERTPAIYPITQSKLKTFLLTAGTQQTYLSQVIRGKLPRSFLFCILDSDQLESKPATNPFFFNHCNLNGLNVFINGEPIHAVAIDPDFANKRYLKEYRWFLNNTGLKNDQTNGINYSEFGRNTCVFTYDLSPDLCNGVYKHGIEAGSIDISLNFSEALAKNHTLLLYASYDEQVLIDKNRVVTIVT
jgi:hypothetical protein